MFISVNYKVPPFAIVPHGYMSTLCISYNPPPNLTLFKQPKHAFNLFYKASRSDGAKKDNCTARQASLNR